MSDRDVILDLMERAEERRNANVLTIEAPPLTEWSYPPNLHSDRRRSQGAGNRWRLSGRGRQNVRDAGFGHPRRHSPQAGPLRAGDACAGGGAGADVRGGC